MLWKKKPEPIRSAEYDDVLKKISALNHSLEEMKTKFVVLETNYNDLRGKFNRKLNIIKDQEREDEPQSLNKPFSPFL